MELSDRNGFDTGAGATRDAEPSRDRVYAEVDSAALTAAPAEPVTTWFRVANGIEAGIVGGLAMLALQFSESLWDGHVWWEIPNLLGSTFYGPRAFRAGTGIATIAGIALHFVITGCLGGLFGLAFGGIQQRGRLVILGLAAAVGWYNLANAAFWPTVNPWVPATAPRPGTVVSHVLLGACLGFMGQRGRLWKPMVPPGPPGLGNHTLAPSSEPAGFIASDEFVSPDEIPLSNAQIAAAQVAAGEQIRAAERHQPPAAAASDALE